MKLDSEAALDLVAYLRDDCRAAFVDLSGLGCWARVASDLALAMRKGSRATRSLALDGNDLSSPAALEGSAEASFGSSLPDSAEGPSAAVAADVTAELATSACGAAEAQ